MYNFNAHIEIVQIPTKYTSGAEKILIKTLLDIEIPSGEFASDYGVLCQNVGTVKAIYDAVIDNKPLISRIVTVTGSAVKEPRNYEARLGTSFASVVAQSKPKTSLHCPQRIQDCTLGFSVTLLTKIQLVILPIECSIFGTPLISRIVTVTGSAVKEPRNYEARLGTSFASVVAQSKPNNKVHQIRILAYQNNCCGNKSTGQTSLHCPQRIQDCTLGFSVTLLTKIQLVILPIECSIKRRIEKENGSR
jgi:Na+-transporting NADH:ubiquinone oxidoreductase subunit NqrA